MGGGRGHGLVAGNDAAQGLGAPAGAVGAQGDEVEALWRDGTGVQTGQLAGDHQAGGVGHRRVECEEEGNSQMGGGVVGGLQAA